MKHTPIQKHRGFFDMGISLVILALGGGTAVAVNNNHEDSAIAQKQEPAITAEAPARETLISYDIDS